MATTYDPSEASTRDQIRGLLADTGEADTMLLQDETIDAYVARYSLGEAKAQLADRLANTFARLAMDIMEANRREMYAGRAAHYRALAQRFRSEGSTDLDGNTQGSVSVGQMTAPDLTLYRVD